MKTYIWTVPMRLFHWLLAIGFAAAYLLGDFDELHDWHFAFGAFVGSLLFFRILFGLVGSKYAHFRDFPIGIKNQLLFLKSFSGEKKSFVGHNPAASLVMLAIFFVGVATSISGFMLYSSEHTTFLKVAISEHTLEEVHEVLANLFLILVVFHLIGLVVDTIFHGKAQTIKSMATGYKNLEAEPSTLTSFQKTFAALWLIVPFVLFYLAYGLPISEEGEDEKSEYSQDNEQFEDEESEEHEEHEGRN